MSSRKQNPKFKSQSFGKTILTSKSAQKADSECLEFAEHIYSQIHEKRRKILEKFKQRFFESSRSVNLSQHTPQSKHKLLANLSANLDQKDQKEENKKEEEGEPSESNYKQILIKAIIARQRELDRDKQALSKLQTKSSDLKSEFRKLLKLNDYGLERTKYDSILLKIKHYQMDRLSRVATRLLGSHPQGDSFLESVGLDLRREGVRGTIISSSQMDEDLKKKLVLTKQLCQFSRMYVKPAHQIFLENIRRVKEGLEDSEYLSSESFHHKTSRRYLEDGIKSAQVVEDRLNKAKISGEFCQQLALVQKNEHKFNEFGVNTMELSVIRDLEGQITSLIEVSHILSIFWFSQIRGSDVSSRMLKCLKLQESGKRSMGSK